MTGKKIGCIALAKIYTAVQTFWVRKMFYVFDAYAYQGCLKKKENFVILNKSIWVLIPLKNTHILTPNIWTVVCFLSSNNI